MINKARKTYIYKKSVLFLAWLPQGGRPILFSEKLLTQQAMSLVLIDWISLHPKNPSQRLDPDVASRHLEGQPVRLTHGSPCNRRVAG